MKTTLILLTGMLATVPGVGAFLLFQRETASPRQPAGQPWTYQGHEVTANGVVEGARPEITLRAEVAGRIAALHARENTEVSQGMVVVELGNETQKHQVALAAAELAAARADLAKIRKGERQEKRAAAAALEQAKKALFLNTQADLDRAQKTMAGNAISREQFDAAHFGMLRAKADWEQAQAERALIEAPPRPEDVAAAEARVAAAQARLHLAQAELSKTQLPAPCRARILQVLAEPGEMTGPENPRPILILADLSKCRVRAFVEELDGLRVKAGQKAVITSDAFPGKEYAGTVTVVLSRMGKRGAQSDAPGEFKDMYFREALIDLAMTEEVPINLRVQVRIHTGEDVQAGP